MSTNPWAYGVLGSFVFMVTCNILASKKFFGGKDNKELSDENPTYLSPDGLTFAVWGMIYLLEMVLVIAQLFPSEASDDVLEQRCPITGLDVRERIALAFVVNGVYIGFAAGLTMNCSWVVVATCVSGFFCLGRVGWKDEHGVAGSPLSAGVVIALVTIIACERALVSCDFAWAFVAAWALTGIFRMQTVPDKVRFPLSAMSDTLGATARGCSYLVMLAMGVGLFLALKG
eukprot:Skav215621  [mRNA]  locus=scaffold666:655317:661832:- [translate_table: standard]